LGFHPLTQTGSAAKLRTETQVPLYCMKVLLRNVRTGLFYVDEHQWTGQHEQAHDFENPDLALNAVDTASLAGVEVVCHFEDPLFDLPLTIHRRATG